MLSRPAIIFMYLKHSELNSPLNYVSLTNLVDYNKLFQNTINERFERERERETHFHKSKNLMYKVH